MRRRFFFLAFAVFLFAATITLAQQQSPQSSRRAQTKLKPAASRLLRFRYRMAYSGQRTYLAGFSEVVVSGGGSGSPAQSPRRGQPALNKSVNITFKRGVVHQDSSFAQWVIGSRAAQMRDVVIDSFDETGKKSSSMHLGRCLVAEYHSQPELDGPANSATIQVMTLHCATLKRPTN